MEERTSRSVWKIEVGSYKDGRKRYEYRHVNDLKFAHPKSLAAPSERPKLGRPSTVTVQSKSSTPTEPTTTTSSGRHQGSSNRLSQVPNPPESQAAAENKQTGSKTPVDAGHATPSSGKIQTFKTLSGNKPHPEYLKKGPLITDQMYHEADWPTILDIGRPKRSTRNPNPQYIDSIEISGPPPHLGSPFHRPKAWSASTADLASINNSIVTFHGEV